MKSWITALGVGIAVCLAAAFLLTRESGQQQPELELERQSNIQPNASASEGARLNPEISESSGSLSAGTVQRIPNVPNRVSRPSTSPVERPEADRITLAVQEEDPAAAVNLLVTLHACRSAPSTSKQMDDRLRAIDEARENPDVAPESVQALEDQILSESPLAGRCYELHNAREDLFKNLLREEAEAGNQVARFFYSMWAPSDAVSTVIGGALLVEYEANALRFTLENLAERSPLGLMAMGISYVEGEYFTPKRESLGSAYLMATQLCGLNHPLIDGLLQTSAMTRHAMKTFKLVATDEQINEAAVRIHAESCDLGVSGLSP